MMSDHPFLLVSKGSLCHQHWRGGPERQKENAEEVKYSDFNVFWRA